jgi:SAM-dependent methyltransferase
MRVFLPRPDSGESRLEMIDFFRRHLIKHGPGSPMALGWDTRQTQEVRHGILTREIAADSRVIDFGCGVGDLYGFFKRTGRPVSYQGFDIVQEMVKAARKKHPGVKFSCRGSLNGIAPKSCDHIVACGAFTFRLRNHFEYLLDNLARFARVARTGFSFDLLDINELSQVEDKDTFGIDRHTLERVLQGLDYRIETVPEIRSHLVIVRLNGSSANAPLMVRHVA